MSHEGGLAFVAASLKISSRMTALERLFFFRRETSDCKNWTAFCSLASVKPVTSSHSVAQSGGLAESPIDSLRRVLMRFQFFHAWPVGLFILAFSDWIQNR